MKRFLVVLLVLALMVSMLAGCAKDDGEPTTGDETPATTDQTTDAGDEAVVGGFAKVGLGHVVSAAKSKDAEGDKGPYAEVGTTLAAVAINEDGTLGKVIIDVAQSKVEFDKDGQLITDINELQKPKNELKEDYGMKVASSIDKEWYEQAAALAEWMEGKTIDEVKGMKVEDGKAAEAELTSAITVGVGDYLAAVEEAYDNAISVGAEGGVKLGMGIETSVGKSKSAEDDNGAVAQVDTAIAVAAFDADGKVVGAINDHVQSTIKFDKAGKLATVSVDADGNEVEDKTTPLASKNEIKEAYGMKKAAAETNKEWYEQAAALADWYVGRTVSEITSMKTREKDANHPVVPDVPELEGAVSIDVQSNFNTIEKAYNNAK